MRRCWSSKGDWATAKSFAANPRCACLADRSVCHEHSRYSDALCRHFAKERPDRTASRDVPQSALIRRLARRTPVGHRMTAAAPVASQQCTPWACAQQTGQRWQLSRSWVAPWRQNPVRVTMGDLEAHVSRYRASNSRSLWSRHKIFLCTPKKYTLGLHLARSSVSSILCAGSQSELG